MNYTNEFIVVEDGTSAFITDQLDVDLYAKEEGWSIVSKFDDWDEAVECEGELNRHFIE